MEVKTPENEQPSNEPNEPIENADNIESIDNPNNIESNENDNNRPNESDNNVVQEEVQPTEEEKPKKVIKKKVIIKKKKKKETTEQGGNESNEEETISLNSTQIKQKEAEYIAQIEQLQNELQIERQITTSIQSDPLLDDEISKLQSLLALKSSKLVHLQNTNDKQAKALESLKKDLKKYMTPNTNSVLNHRSEISKENPIDIVLKVKNKELNNALALIDALSKDNAKMKRDIDASGDYKARVELIDTSRAKNEKIARLNKEIELMNKELEAHKKCVEEQKENMTILENLRKELKEAKALHLCLRQTYKEKNDMNKNLMNSNRKKTTSINNTTPNNNIAVNVPVINSQNEKKKDKSIYSDNCIILIPEVKEKLKSIIKDENEYKELNEKIIKLETGKKEIDKKYKEEIRQLSYQINNFQREMEGIIDNGKEIESKNKIYQYSLNDIKKEQKGFQKKLIEAQSNLDRMNKISKEKDDEINALITQLNSLRKIVKNGTVDPLETEVEKYIEKIKIESNNK